MSLPIGSRGPAAAGDDDAVDPAFEQGAQVVLLPDLVVPAVAQEHRDAPGPSASSAPCMTGMLNRPKLSVVISPTVKVRPASSPRASALGW